MNAGRTGPAQTISDTVIARLPVRSRDFAQLTYLSPQAAVSPNGGVSIAGQSDRLNGFQIDGATNLDLTGYGRGFGTPGALSGVRTLSVEALEELQVLSAPFDVRYGTFAGGLINAVTRSGANDWHGSFSGYYENQSLTGKDSAGTRTEDFTTGEFALTLGGPIVKNRAAFFIDFGLQRDLIPQSEPAIGPTAADSAAVGVSYASAVRFQEILRNTYRVDAGSFAAAPIKRPSQNFFAKVTLQPALNNRIEFSYNYGHGTSRVDGRSCAGGHLLALLQRRQLPRHHQRPPADLDHGGSQAATRQRDGTGVPPGSGAVPASIRVFQGAGQRGRKRAGGRRRPLLRGEQFQCGDLCQSGHLGADRQPVVVSGQPPAHLRHP